MKRSPLPNRILPLVAAVAALVVYALLTWYLRSGSGLVETFYDGTGAARQVLAERLTAGIGLEILDDRADLRRDVFTIRWTGAWFVPRSDIYAIHLEADDLATLRVDDRLVQAFWVRDPQAKHVRAVPLEAGFRRFELEYEQHGAHAALALRIAPFGKAVRPIEAEALLPAMPARPRLHAAAMRLRPVVGWLAVALAVLFTFRTIVPWLRRLAHPRPTVTRGLAIGVVVLITGYGALLRLDALTFTHGVVESPRWLRAVQQARLHDSALRPDAFTWQPRVGRYTSDPYTYLQYAREMRSFYAAHRREPLFPFATKVALALLNDQDVAVSFASAFFSVLAIVATFLLGARAFSSWVGGGAAAAMAIEYDLVTWGIGGWRDDAFTCAVVLSAVAMLAYARDPSSRNAIVMGIVAGVACLVRITALSFLAPGFLFLLLTLKASWRERVRGLALATLVAGLVVGPYLFNCWRVFGDPLYSINVHADIYRTAEGQEVEESQTAAEYLRGKALREPMQTLDTAMLGMTAYPFGNKWVGFDRWHPDIGWWLSRASAAGLLLFLLSPAGRLLLVVLAGSLVPYALTWRLIGDWRFTEHAYPFFLIAACYTFVAMVRVAASLAGGEFQRPRITRQGLAWAAAFGVVALVTWFTVRWLPPLVAREVLRQGEAVTVMPGPRDAAFFRDGWSRAMREGTVTARASQVEYPELHLPLVPGRDYDLTLRLDPFPRPLHDSPRLPAVRVFLNSRLLAHLQLTWNPERVGAYDVSVPAAAVTGGTNRLVLMPDTAGADPEFDALRIWYVRARPK